MNSTTVRIERIPYGTGDPKATIIIPTRDGDRSGLLSMLLDDLKEQTLQDFEVLLIIGDNRQGRAINRGVTESKAEIVFTMDDDTVVLHPELLSNLIRELQSHANLGIVGASTVIPPDSSWLQRTACKQIPRRYFPVVKTLTDSDMVQHPCLAMRKSVFLEIGGEDEELVRGLDPLLRRNAKRAGYRVCIAPNSYIGHPLPESLTRIIRMYFRNGRGSAFAQRHFPDRIFNLTDGYRNNEFPEKVPFALRALQFPGRLFGSLFRCKWIALAVHFAYAAGYFSEYFFGARAGQAATATHS